MTNAASTNAASSHAASSTPAAVIVDAVRSPMGRGKATGALASVHPTELLAQVLTALVERNGIDPGSVDDLLVGCVGQNGEQSATPGRQAWLAAGYPVHVPATTIERKCGSSQQAVDFARYGIAAGAYDIAIAAGVESMSRVPMGSGRQGADPHGPRVHARFPGLVPQGVSAELVADRWKLSREDLDDYSAQSHARAAAAQRSGGFAAELVPVALPDGTPITADETIRPATTTEALAALTPAFGTDEMRARFPDIDWKVTAGNSSQITDGAAAVLLMSEHRAAALGLRPRARIVASAVVGDDPVLMLTGPIPATQRVLQRAGLTIDDIDAVEINEAFASVPLAWLREFAIDPAKVNPRGGAIALGHPLGASGTRLLTTLLTHLEATGGRYGLQTMCEAGGMANALIVERLG
jgi:acetyl-CoA acetyltransferase family protein